MHKYDPVNSTDNFKPANEVKEAPPVVASPAPKPAIEHLDIVTPSEVRAHPPLQPDKAEVDASEPRS